MPALKYSLLLFLTLLLTQCSNAQDKNRQRLRLVGGPCQGCEAVLDYGERELRPTDTLPGFEENEPKIKITGTVYERDGKTPAQGVVLFVHQANREGVYPKKGHEEGWARSYGYIHGWVRTGTDGKYTFYTFRPGSYSSNPAHIHPIILEPNGRYYWLGSFLFAGDPKLSDAHYHSESPRGGSNGILSLRKENGLWVGRRDFILGKHIPGYE